MEDQFSSMRSFAINGTELAYVEEGQGDPVVLVHGGVSDLRTWNYRGRDKSLSMLARSPVAGLAILKLGATVMEPAAKAFRRGDDKAAIEIFGRGVLGSSRFDRFEPSGIIRSG